MSSIREKNSGTNLIKYYDLDSVNTGADAITWLYTIRETEGFSMRFISYMDLLNRFDEGSESTEFLPEDSLETLKNELQNRRIDMISIVGDYYDKHMVIGVDLHTFEIHITIDKSDPADIQRMERLLNLV